MSAIGQAPASPAVDAADRALLTVDGLRVEVSTAGERRTVVDDVSFELRAGEVLGLVGESGSGKTMTALSVLGLLPPAAHLVAGSVRLGDRDLARCTPRELQAVRGNELAMVFQDPMTSLNPALTVGRQIVDVVRHHRAASRRDAWSRAVEVLGLVGIPDARRRASDYPHTFSGGMRQRALLALALACEPALLVADEPTTALDVTVQAQVLELLADLQQRLGMAVLFVTHDLGVVAHLCDRVAVMYASRLVETAGVFDLFERPEHPYTQALLTYAREPSTGGEA